MAVCSWQRPPGQNNKRRCQKPPRTSEDSHVTTSNRRRFLTLTAATLAMPAVPRLAFADVWPKDRTIRAIVPFTGGSTIDIIGRIVTDPVSRQIGQNIIIENRGGAGGSLGSAMVAK